MMNFIIKLRHSIISDVKKRLNYVFHCTFNLVRLYRLPPGVFTGWDAHGGLTARDWVPSGPIHLKNALACISTLRNSAAGLLNSDKMVS